MQFNHDAIILWQWHFLHLNATMIFSFLVTIILSLGSYILSTHLKKDIFASKWQLAFEIIIEFIERQIENITQNKKNDALYFICTLFLYIALSNLLELVPFFFSPCSSLSTTIALAVCVLFAVPYFSIKKIGLLSYLKQYISPSVLMLPFNIIGELSRTLALAIRLYGNIMSGSVIVGILISLMPFVFPVIMNLFGLLTGMIQAYIFSVLAMVYIASASRGG